MPRVFPLPWDATECSFASWEKSTCTIARRLLPSLFWPSWRHFLVATVAFAKHLVQNVAPQSIPGELTRRIVAGLQDGSIFDVLTNVVVFTAGIFYMLSVLAVIVLRFRQPTLRRPYRTWGYPLAPSSS